MLGALVAVTVGTVVGAVAGYYRRWVDALLMRGVDVGLALPRIFILLMVIVGGSGYFLGPFLGAIVSVLLPEWLRAAEGLYLIFYAIAVMVLMAFCPSGLLGLAERSRRLFR